MTGHDQRELEKKWTAELEKLGVEVVMLKLNRDNVGQGRGAAFRVLLPNGMPETTRGFVEDWLADKGREEKSSDTRQFIFFGLAALVSILLALLSIHFLL